MAEERIFIETGELKLEGLLDHTSDERGVVVTHPHPLYGGTMHNSVVKGVLTSCAVALLGVMAIALPFGVYFFLRFGAKRCPQCRKLVWGLPGAPIGIRRMHFRCKTCGVHFQGHKRLPL